MTTTKEKLTLLHDILGDEPEMDRILENILLLQRETYRKRLQRYDDDLRMFEQRYRMASDMFARQFEQGLLGDEMDFFEWSGLIELRQVVLNKIHRLEGM